MFTFSHRTPVVAALLAAVWLGGAGAAAPAADQTREDRKVEAARRIGERLLLGPERVVPQPLLRQTRCLAIFPRVTEAAFGLGGSHGTGVASCRDAEGTWTPPAFLRLSGGSLGLQIGFRRVDLIFFFVTERGARSLAEANLSFGGEASVAAGPIDRRAEISTERLYERDIYLYAEARGLFAGASIEGSRLAAARRAAERYYQRPLWPEQILFQGAVEAWPDSARQLAETLARLPSLEASP